MILRFTLFVFIHVYLFRSVIYGSQKVPVILNTKLETAFLIKTVGKGTLPSCVDTCVFITDCLSVSYNRITQTCGMFNSSSRSVGQTDYLTENHAVMIDAVDWPKFRTGECWQKPCPAKMKCVTTVGSYSCQIEGGLGCKPYSSLPDHGTLVDHDGLPTNTTQSLYEVGAILNLGCAGIYMTNDGDPDAYWQTTCQNNREWTSIDYECYTSPLICNYELLERFYPSRAQISVTSSVPGWNENETLMDSGSGWIAGTIDDNQYIQVEFDQPYWIGGLITSGGVSNKSWVSSYNVSYSENCTNYDFVPGHNGTFTFEGNIDWFDIEENGIIRPVSAKCLRVHPVTYSGGIGMRLEIQACRNYP